MVRLLTEFDQQVEDLSQERMQLSIDIKYLEIFVNVLNQELHIVHSYDETEAAILERVNYSLAEKHTKHLKVKTIRNYHLPYCIYTLKQSLRQNMDATIQLFSLKEALLMF